MAEGTSIRVSVCALVLVLSLATVYDQYRAQIPLSPGGNPHRFLEENQVGRNYATLHGLNGDPWQYRVGSEWIAKEFRLAARSAGFHEPAVAGFLTFRFVQNAAIFALAWLLYRRFGLSPFAAALGLALVAWAMTQANNHGGLAFDTYTDVVVYLGAAHLILSRRYLWVVPLTALAALSRETSALVPLMLMATAIPLGPRTPEGRRALVAGLAALAAFAVATTVLRIVVGPGDHVLAYGKPPGFDLFKINLERGDTWEYLFRTVTIVPVLALWRLRMWPEPLRWWALAIGPLWVAAVFVAAVPSETRLFLVPYVLLLVPGALAGLQDRRDVAPNYLLRSNRQ